MPYSTRLASALLLVLSLALSACASGVRTLTPEDYRQRLSALEAAAERSPDRAAAHRDLGEALAQTGDPQRALAAFERADALDGEDPKTRYYLGLTLEALGRDDEALAAYADREGLAPGSPFVRAMQGRYRALRREKVRGELVAMIALEDSLASGEPTEAVAVFPFAYRSDDPLYAPLGRGLSEMVSVDLLTVGRIRQVERIRLQVLLDELSLASGDAFDPATAPRVGRLLGSGRIVGGAVDVRGDRVETDIALWAWPTEPTPEAETRGASLEELFRLQKEIVFGLIDDLGVTLTAAERERIETVPTRDLQAFLAYSRGLQEEDAGRFAEAATLFRQAMSLDPGFEQAQEAAEEVEAEVAMGGDVETVMAGAREIAGAAAPLASASLASARLGHLNGSLGAHVVPGNEGREPGAEVPPSAPTIPDPPLPPSGGN